MTELIYKDEVYKIIGAAFEVYNQLGPGFLEAVYQEALETELIYRQIPFIAQCKLPIYYKDQCLSKFYICDFLIFDKIIVEIKALDSLTSIDDAQLLNQLKASHHELGLLINFGSTTNLEWNRRIFTVDANLAISNKLPLKISED